jgi:hypothetical protein
MRLVGGAMTEQIQGDDLSAGLGKEIHPTGLSPLSLKGRGKAMDEEDRLSAHARERTGGRPPNTMNTTLLAL